MSRMVNHYRMSAYVKDNKITRCELCNKKADLEVHHIVPICCGGADTEDNYLAICAVCHAKLTPKSQLTKIGMHGNAIEKHINDFYKGILAEIDDGVSLSSSDIMVYVNELTAKIRECMKGDSYE